MDPAISMAAHLRGNYPNLDFDITSMLADPLLSPLPNHDSFESWLEQGGSRLTNDEPTCSQHANKETEVLISPDLDPNDPDHQAVEMLRRMSTAKDCPIKNENLSLHPSLIPTGASVGYSLLPGKVFVSDEFDLLEKDKLADGSWKKFRAGMGWGIKDTCTNTFIALKRTFEFYSENCKTAWVMDVYAQMEFYGWPFTAEPCPKYLCHVFQSNNYDPRPRARRCDTYQAIQETAKWKFLNRKDSITKQGEAVVTSVLDQRARNPILNPFTITNLRKAQPITAGCGILGDPGTNLECLFTGDENCGPNAEGPSTGIASENCDRNAEGPSTRIASENCDLNAEGPSTRIASENCDLNAEGPSTRIASGKKRKTAVWDNFTEVSISNGPAGKVLTLCICNCCGMAYRKTSGTSTLAKHRCSNDYLTSNQPETASGTAAVYAVSRCSFMHRGTSS